MADEVGRSGAGAGEPEGTSAVHVPVLLDRVLELLDPAVAGGPATVVDATLGLGGHTDALLSAHPQLRVVGLDRDPDALRRSTERLAGYGDRAQLVHAVYDELDGVLFDLGVSSLQLDSAARGFSYAQDAGLDMRMDPTVGQTAADVLNSYSAADLTRVLREYGEERFAARIANAIVRERARSRLVSSTRLVELVRDAVPAATRRTGGNPAKRTFQALRIEVNGELDALRAALPAALAALRVGGRLVVLAYQSLEDRMVKHALAEVSSSRTPIGVPVELPEYAPTFRLLTRGAESAAEAEVATNPRAASVRLRAAERIREAA